MKKEYRYLIRKNKSFSINGLKYLPTKRIFKGCNGKCVFNPQSFESFSYGHWKFVFKYKNKIIFNNYRYSNTTTRHQHAIKSLLKSLNIDFIEFNLGNESLNSNSFITALKGYYYTLYLMQDRLTRSRNKGRTLTSIVDLKDKIKLINKLGFDLKVNEKILLKYKALDNEKTRLEKNKANKKSTKLNIVLDDSNPISL